MRVTADRKKYILLGSWEYLKNAMALSPEEGPSSCLFFLTKETHAFSCHPHWVPKHLPLLSIRGDIGCICLREAL